MFLEVNIDIFCFFYHFFLFGGEVGAGGGGEVILVSIHVNQIQFIFLQLNLGTCLVMPAGKSSFCLVASHPVTLETSMRQYR